MTNLIATIVVCVVTNVVDADNARAGCEAQVFDGIYMICSVYGCEHKDIIPATERTKTTTISEVTRLTFEWMGKGWNAVHERVLSEVVERWVKKESWEKQ